jgi:hypothetical protein
MANEKGSGGWSWGDDWRRRFGSKDNLKFEISDLRFRVVSVLFCAAIGILARFGGLSDTVAWLRHKACGLTARFASSRSKVTVRHKTEMK